MFHLVSDCLLQRLVFQVLVSEWRCKSYGTLISEGSLLLAEQLCRPSPIVFMKYTCLKEIKILIVFRYNTQHYLYLYKLSRRKRLVTSMMDKISVQAPNIMKKMVVTSIEIC